MYLFVFFDWCGAHRDLHSFPTRRSSDLARPPKRLVRPCNRMASDTAGSIPRAMRIGLALRSEEHTSELQSHLNLVCRLLLEKKKKEIKRPTDMLTRMRKRLNDLLTCSRV